MGWGHSTPPQLLISSPMSLRTKVFTRHTRAPRLTDCCLGKGRRCNFPDPGNHNSDAAAELGLAPGRTAVTLIVPLLKLESASHRQDSPLESGFRRGLPGSRNSSNSPFRVCYHLFDWLCGSDSPLHGTPLNRFPAGSQTAWRFWFPIQARCGVAGKNEKLCLCRQ